MGRAPCCDKQGMKKGPWTPEEDKILVDYIQSNGHGSWSSLPKLAGLLRCGKSCRLRWTNYLRPDIKRGSFTPDEQKSIIQLHGIVGNKWSTIAAQLPGRTDNEIKNYWNIHLKKRLLRMGLNPDTYTPALLPSSSGSSSARHMAQWENARLQAEVRLSREFLVFSTTTPTSATALAAESSSITPSTASASSISEDFFLRIWNSEVGDKFRRVAVAVAAARAEGSKSCCVSASSSNEDEGSDESYQLYLDFSGSEEVQYGSCDEPFAAGELNANEAVLDTSFKF